MQMVVREFSMGGFGAKQVLEVLDLVNENPLIYLSQVHVPLRIRVNVQTHLMRM